MQTIITFEGRVLEVKKKQYCFYLVCLDLKTRTRHEWVVDPNIWYKGPIIDIVPGQLVRLRGVKEVPAVSVRGLPPRSARFRASAVVELVTVQRASAASSSSAHAEAREKPYMSTHMVPRSFERDVVENNDVQQRKCWTVDVVVRHIREILEHPPKRVRLIPRNSYQCFTPQLLHEHLPHIPEVEISKCVTHMVRNGDAANVSVTEGLFTLITYHDFLAPALLMVLHGHRQCRSIPDDDGAFFLDEWIEVCMRKFCGRLNVPQNKLYESAKRLVEQGLAVITENGKYRRPYQKQRHQQHSQSSSGLRLKQT